MAQKKTEPENTVTETGKEISRSLFSSAELQGITSFDEALELAATKYGAANLKLVSDVIGNGFKLLDSKDHLVGVTFAILKWDFNAGDFGEFASMYVVTAAGDKYVVNDGSTGIRDQLSAYSAQTGMYGGLVCKNGLRRSDYEYDDDEGKKKKATTFYLDSSV